MSDTLILNADGNPLSILPISIINWQDAIRLLVCDKVSAVKHHDNWIVRSPSVEMRVPSVVMVRHYIKWKRVVKCTRANVFLRDEYICQLCNKKPSMSELTLDHVIPSSLGGRSTWTNLVTACRRCNERKGNNHKVRPKKDPWRPSYYEMIAKRQKYPIRIRDQFWLTYLAWPEELVYLQEPKGN